MIAKYRQMGEFHIRDLEPMTPEQRAEWFKKLTDEDAIALWNHWPAWTVAGQDAPPSDDWPLWLVMAGRGFGKTRMGAQWVWERALSAPDLRIAIVGATMAEARAVMVEGESGLLSATPLGAARPLWEPSKGLLRWANGAQATLYSGENPESLRGPQHHFAWCDEIAKWAHADDLWNNLQLGLRLGDRPQALVTTTPRAIPLMRALIRRAQDRGVLSTGHRLKASNRGILRQDIRSRYANPPIPEHQPKT
jgi:phage terminase large subunit-like protein